jgi:DNA-damage-inducible protein J
MTKSAFIHVRIEPGVKTQAEKLLDKLGISSSQAITMLYKYVIREHSWPLALKIPNDETRRAFEETDKGIGLIKCKNTAEMFKNLGI